MMWDGGGDDGDGGYEDRWEDKCVAKWEWYKILCVILLIFLIFKNFINNILSHK